MPPTMIVRSEYSLSGEVRFRTNWRGQIILQVEETWRRGPAPRHPGQEEWGAPLFRWRDARPADLINTIGGLAASFHARAAMGCHPNLEEDQPSYRRPAFVRSGADQ